jgi:hypothetical protein
VHANNQFLFYFLQSAPLIDPSQKVLMFLIFFLKNAIFYQYGTMESLPFSHLYKVQEQTFGHRIWDKL